MPYLTQECICSTPPTSKVQAVSLHVPSIRCTAFPCTTFCLQTKFAQVHDLAAFFFSNVSAVVGPHGELPAFVAVQKLSFRATGYQLQSCLRSTLNTVTHQLMPTGGAWYNYMFLSAPDTLGLEFLPMGAPAARWASDKGTCHILNTAIGWHLLICG